MERDLLMQGGWILWIIMASGFLALAVFIERSLHLHRARIRSEDFMRGIFNILDRGNVDEAITICEETPGPVAYLMKTALQHRDEEREVLTKSLSDASRAEVSRMERRLVVVATVAQVSPLLGLLGTVVGLLESVLITRYQIPLVQSVNMLGGLEKALITTVGGLMVAIPCYAAFNVLVIKIDRIVLDMERVAAETVAYLSRMNRSRSAGVAG